MIKKPSDKTFLLKIVILQQSSYLLSNYNPLVLESSIRKINNTALFTTIKMKQLILTSHLVFFKLRLFNIFLESTIKSNLC